MAQGPPPALGKIVGKVFDSSSEVPLQFATISIFDTDSKLVTGGISEADGSFSVDVRPGTYTVTIQFIAFESSSLADIEVGAINRTYDVGKILLQPETKNLEEVQVIGEKSEMVINLDKKVFNVGKDLSNTGQTALDILDNIPSLTVDLDGNVSLRGSQNLQILIDGKPSGLVSGGSTDALKNLQGSMIERVEVITNPSARYEAEGMAGIINIILRKDQQKGVNGSFELTAGYPQNYSAGANVNFRREKINYFLNYNIRYNERPGGGYSWQQFNLPDTSYITVREMERNRAGLSNRVRAGADIFLSPTSTLTLAGLLAYDDQMNIATVQYNDYLYSPSDQITLREIPGSDRLAYFTERIDTELENQLDMEFSLHYDKKFDKDDHKLTAMFQFIHDAEVETSNILENFDSYLDNNDQTVSNPTQRVNNAETETNFLAKADYVYPFGNKGMFEAGYQGEVRLITNPYYVDTETGDDQWERLTEYSNTFEYVENIQALYVQAGKNFGKFSLQGGLRAELSDVRTYLLETDSANERLYLNLFPSVHSSFEFNTVHSAQLSYSKRIHRPHFWFLNPFFSYTDPRNYRSGNPNLEPEYIHSFEVGYLLKKQKINFYSGIFYRYSTNVMERVNEIAEYAGNTVTVVTPQNLAEGQSYGLEANATLNMVPWWTLSGDVNFYRRMIDGSYNGIDLSSDYYSWNTRLNSKFRLPKNTDIQLIFFYRAPEESVQGERETFYMLNGAISKDVLKGKGTLTFNVRDILNSMQFRFILDQEELYSYNEFHRVGRIYNLTFVYRLNQNKRFGQKNDQQNGNNGNGDFGGDEMGF
ncbi:MAG: TonB-dependent receptor [Bacteroidales bacterium]|nr:TonB-dependent receptor [Bacteroidales bacterium]